MFRTYVQIEHRQIKVTIGATDASIIVRKTKELYIVMSAGIGTVV